jgi:hypothetical protein
VHERVRDGLDLGRVNIMAWVYPVLEASIDFDWSTLYGPEWAGMQGATPVSTVLSVGSEIAVYPKGKLLV